MFSAGSTQQSSECDDAQKRLPQNPGAMHLPGERAERSACEVTFLPELWTETNRGDMRK